MPGLLALLGYLVAVAIGLWLLSHVVGAVLVLVNFAGLPWWGTGLLSLALIGTSGLIWDWWKARKSDTPK